MRDYLGRRECGLFRWDKYPGLGCWARHSAFNPHDTHVRLCWPAAALAPNGDAQVYPTRILCRAEISAWSRQADNRRWRIRELRQRLKAPETDRLLQRQSDLAQRFRRAGARYLENVRTSLQNLHSHLAYLNPQLVLERGYSVVENAVGNIVRDSKQIASGDEVKMTFAKGTARARVTDKS